MWIISSLQDDMQMNIFSAGEALASLSLLTNSHVGLSRCEPRREEETVCYQQ